MNDTEYAKFYETAQPPSAVPGLLRVVGNFFTGLFATMVTCIVLIGLVWMAVKAAGTRDIPTLIVIAILCFTVLIDHIAFCLRSIFATAGVAGYSEPTMLFLARSQPSAARWRRPILATWWMLHFAFSLAMPWSMLTAPHRPKDWLILVLESIVITIFSSLAFGFALCARACFHNSEPRLKALSNWWWVWGAVTGVAFFIIEALR